MVHVHVSAIPYAQNREGEALEKQHREIALVGNPASSVRLRCWTWIPLSDKRETLARHTGTATFFRLALWFPETWTCP